MRRRVAELGFVRVDQLADECRVSIMTVHRDFLPVVRALAEHPGVELIGLGGRFVASYDSFLGQATAAAGELRTDVLIVSTTAVTDGVCYLQAPDTLVTRRALIAGAARVVVLVDHTKFARRALHRFVDLADVDRVVVDPDTPPGIVDDLAARGVAVAVAEPA